MGSQDGCERIIKVFVKIQKIFWGGGGGGVRVDVIKELKLLGKLKKNKKKLGGGGEGGCGRVGGGGGGGAGVRGGGQGGCE